jgi:protein-S-isoprenylcysteine O-methyltransferase Ste14
MPQVIAETSPVFWTVYIVWFVSEQIRNRTHRPGSDAVVKNQGSLGAVIFALFFGIGAAFVLASTFGAGTLEPQRPWLYVGIAFMLLGMLLRWQAVRTLGKFFTFDVAAHSDHVVIDTGPYTYIRHPSYTGAILTIFGIGLALANWASIAVILVTAFLGYGYRIKVEEEALTERLGDAYRAYARRTHRLIPFIY